MRRVASFIATTLLAACAGTIVRPVADDNTADGIRYYESAPFLLVYTDGRGGISSQLIYLPDVTNIRSIDPYAVLAKNETTITFSRGVLSQSKSVLDETIVPNAAITALETAANAALQAANDPTGSGRQVDLPLPRLYRIVIDSHGRVSLRGGTAVSADNEVLETIQATITQSGPAPKVTENSIEGNSSAGDGV